MQFVLDGEFEIDLQRVLGNPILPEGAIAFRLLDKKTGIYIVFAIPTLQATGIGRRISELCSGGNGYTAEPVYGREDIPDEITRDVGADEG